MNNYKTLWKKLRLGTNNATGIKQLLLWKEIVAINNDRSYRQLWEELRTRYPNMKSLKSVMIWIEKGEDLSKHTIKDLPKSAMLQYHANFRDFIYGELDQIEFDANVRFGHNLKRALVNTIETLSDGLYNNITITDENNEFVMIAALDEDSGICTMTINKKTYKIKYPMRVRSMKLSGYDMRSEIHRYVEYGCDDGKIEAFVDMYQEAQESKFMTRSGGNLYVKYLPETYQLRFRITHTLEDLYMSKKYEVSLISLYNICNG